MTRDAIISASRRSFGGCLALLAAVLAGTLLFAAMLLPLPALAAAEAWTAPHLDDTGQAEYRAYLVAPTPSAFAIAPGGAFGWVSAAESGEAAEAQALARCKSNTRHKCLVYSVDGNTVADPKTWAGLWGPYLQSDAARRAPIGRSLGERFPDLVFTSVAGKKASVWSLRGKVVILHFWGSWCGPCRREMPDMQKAYQSLRKQKDLELILLQVRESFDTSQKWVKERAISLPLYDSGSTGDLDDRFLLSDGGFVHDRYLASRFPTTYVLDKSGIVVFYNIGPISNWAEYEPFLRDVGARSGR